MTQKGATKAIRAFGAFALLSWALQSYSRGAEAQQTTAPLVVAPPITIIAVSPLLGSGIDRNKVPATTNVLSGDDVVRAGIPDALGALNDRVPGVSLGDAQGNAFQPNLVYRGFSASPLDGNAQGLAVYLNGIRFNQPFADTVYWDLLPSIAIDQINLEGSNPAFGLNALGGSLSIQLKNGFTWQGNNAEFFGGSFGTVSGTLQSGHKSGDTATYIAANLSHSDGWRQFNRSDVRQVFGDIGWRSASAELHFDALLADNSLNGPGTVPIELLAVDRGAMFTGPNLTTNKFGLLSLSGSWAISDETSVQGLLYYSNLSQRIRNGNTPNLQPCLGLLCTDGGGLAFDRNGVPISDFLAGGPYSQLNQEATDTNGYGAALQISHETTIFGLHNQLVAGTSFDGGITTFSATSAIGGIDPARNFVGPGIVIDQPDGSITPVRLGVVNAYYGAYVSDVLDLTPRLSLSLSGRLNVATIDLNDRNGTSLTGHHDYLHFNPGAGLTYKLLPTLSVYASASEANRAPTPAELSCASAASPCTLANFFVGDPALKQVVAHTIEAGFRGQFKPRESVDLDWNVGVYRTNSFDDILFVASDTPGLNFFQNVGQTRRQGVEAGVTLKHARFKTWLNYAFIDATVQSSLTLASPLNPSSDANGQIHVAPGNRLPGVPRHRLKFGASYAVTDAWTVGLSGIASSGQYLFGDESNITPKTDAYVVLNANASYQVTPNIQIFGLMQNLLNANYETFGTFSSTNAVPIAQSPGASNPRSLSPAAPRGAFGGVRISF